jgi:ClpP class serine protease
MNRIVSFLTNGTPWAIEPAAFETILSIAQRENDLQAMLAERGQPLDNTHNVEIRDGVAIIPVTGPLFPRANLFQAISGAYSVEMLALDLAAAQSNADVRSAVLMFDTPGGHITMINEFAKQIAAFSKPIVAYVSGSASSAGYFLASATDKIYLDETAMVGSIGVVAGFQKPDSNTIEIVSSHAADKRPDVTTDAGRAVVQSIVDDMEAVFIESIMANRSMSFEQITALRGGVVIGAKAVDSGFADQISTLEQVILNLQTENPMDLQTLQADHPTVYQAAFDEGAASIDANAAHERGVTEERARIKEILNDETAQGREAQAQALALETDLAPEAAAKVLAVSAKTEAPAQLDAVDQFSAHMNKIGNPDVTADADDDAQGGYDAALALIVGGKK